MNNEYRTVDGKMKYGIVLGVFSVVLLSGCETIQSPQQRQQAAARQQAASRYTEERVLRLQGQVETVEAEYGRLMQELQQLREQVRSCNSQISTLNSNMQALDAKQAREMKETLKRVERLIGDVAAAPRSSTPARGSGREHVVESGHTLSAIAQAYGTTVSAIKKANNLKSDSIYIGQKLFIPD
jgi:chromosome segregation ATPase